MKRGNNIKLNNRQDEWLKDILYVRNEQKQIKMFTFNIKLNNRQDY